jgi:hypothetical protein
MWCQRPWVFQLNILLSLEVVEALMAEAALVACKQVLYR